MPDCDDRLSILERAQFLFDATSRRHGDMLDKHEDRMIALETNVLILRQIAERQAATQQSLVETQAKLQDTLDAIKDLLRRRNGH